MNKDAGYDRGRILVFLRFFNLKMSTQNPKKNDGDQKRKLDPMNDPMVWPIRR